MTALVYREDDRHVTVIDEDDGCEPGNHTRSELCARTPLKTLLTDEPAPVTEDDDRGGAT